MAKITYLLGAGASFEALPIVSNFKDEIEKIIKRVETYNNYLHVKGSPPKDSKSILQHAINDLRNLLIGCINHRSVDTYAKMLYLTSDVDERARLYRSTKCAIILFFELYRFYYDKIDKRYDAFLATIINKQSPKLSDDINILSWNYDYEIEKAYMKYYPASADIHEVYNELNIIHKNTRSKRSIGNQFGVVKINGTAGFYHNEQIILGLNQSQLTAKGFRLEDFSRIYPLLKNYYEYSTNNNTFEPAISFSWKDDQGNSKIEEEIIASLKYTEVLIVVGYSFPYFNRKIDSLIIENFKNYRMGKIVVQDPYAEDILENLKEIKNSWTDSSKRTVFIPKKSVDQYYMSF